MPNPLEDEFIALAKEMLDESIPEPNAIWVSVKDSTVVDPEHPWVIDHPTEITRHPVRMLFIKSPLEDRQFMKYRKDTEIEDGQVGGIMAPGDFEPTLKDILLCDGREYTVKAVDRLATLGKVILYYLEFGL